MADFASLIREIPDFPKPGIRFKDITPLLANHEALQAAIKALALPFIGKGVARVLGIESRGFIFAPGVALALGAGFVPVRKPGKLPYKTIGAEYELEYGTDRLEIHEDAVNRGDLVLIVDDLVATGGSAKAAADMVRTLGGIPLALACLIELSFLDPHKKLGTLPIHSLIKY